MHLPRKRQCSANGAKECFQMDHVSELFGSNVFNDDVMKQRLPRETYRQLQLTIKQGKHLDSTPPRAAG